MGILNSNLEKKKKKFKHLILYYSGLIEAYNSNYPI